MHHSNFHDIKGVLQEFYKLELIVLSDKDFDEKLHANRYNVTFYANAAAIELYFLCVEDEQGTLIYYLNKKNFNFF